MSRLLRRLAGAGLLVALGSVLPGATAAPANRPDPSQADDVQDVIFYTASRPMLLRLHLRADGKPAVAKWETQIRKLFDFLDRNGDGALDKEEAARAPNGQAMMQYFQGNAFVQGNPRQGGTASAPADMDPDDDGKVTPAEFAGYYRRNNAGPINLYPTPITAQFSGDQLTESLIAALDRNKDGKLSRDEVKAAADVLAKYDTDDDETVSSAEIFAASGIRGIGQGGVGGVMPGQMGRGGPSQSPLKLVTKEDDGEKLTQRLIATKEILNRYDEDKNGKVSRDELKIDRDLYKKLDTNSDNELDAVELLRWLVLKPDAEVTLRMGKVERGERTADGKTGDGALGKEAVTVKGIADDVVAVGLDQMQLNVTRTDGQGNYGRQNLLQTMTAQFKAVDKDNRGYVVIDQIDQRRSFYLKATAELADRDDDGRMTEKELKDYVALIEGGVGLQLTVWLADNGRGLFDVFDTNKDGRLSRRELLTSSDRVAPYLRTGDDELTRERLPRQYQLTVGRGLGVPQQRQGVRAGTTARTGGPTWFHKMDANGDGEISGREWLGTPGDFRKLDGNSDGVVSQEEAEKIDGEARKPAGQS